MTVNLPQPIERFTTGPLTPDDLRERLCWIAEYIYRNGWAPSHREMGPGWSVSAAAVKTTLEKLEEIGWIVWVQGQGRMLRITDEGLMQVPQPMGLAENGSS